jgi:hypothetical protein
MSSICCPPQVADKKKIAVPPQVAMFVFVRSLLRPVLPDPKKIAVPPQVAMFVKTRPRAVKLFEYKYGRYCPLVSVVRITRHIHMFILPNPEAEYKQVSGSADLFVWNLDISGDVYNDEELYN